MRATYFDGRTAAAHDVEIHIDGDMFVVFGGDVDRRDPIGAVEITDAIGATPRIVRFVGGASCQVLDAAAFGEFLHEHGIAPSRVSNWERNWRSAGISLVLLAAIVTTGYLVGLPLLAESTADRLPDNALRGLSEQIQRALDNTVFSESAVPPERRAAILTRFDAFRLPAETKRRLRLDFRKAPALGANAMALPSGTIFITDDLIAALDDRHVMAVIAHEAGHVDKRHGLRKIIQSSVIGILVTWYVGDISAVAAAAPTALMQAKYSRDLEREADAYAVEVLRLNSMPPSLLAEALEGLERSHAEQPGKASQSGALAYLSTHPATSERLEWLRAQH